MAPLAELLSRLRAVRALRFDARSEAATGWNGVGAGTVTVSEPSAGVVVFEETGTWQPPDRPAIGFRNVFRWSVAGAVLRLEHLRFGPDEPVFLIDMAPGADGEWHEVRPHQCRDDCYTAAMKIEGGTLLVAWSVQGPSKRESIRYTYW
ncbi:hypothetical protein FTUN_5238 [Frigoriglobus tundricola]|uniref:DUF6314 domain-containing protein n=2 Tax=Frigoriglobus tundricola TaxID=2774151 RepID=A0A6M5YWI5_9BACT|nr:hypothetical protein FTUN_5238 [Frigoriglobus tundricola]